MNDKILTHIENKIKLLKIKLYNYSKEDSFIDSYITCLLDQIRILEELYFEINSFVKNDENSSF